MKYVLYVILAVVAVLVLLLLAAVIRTALVSFDAASDNMCCFRRGVGKYICKIPNHL